MVLFSHLPNFFFHDPGICDIFLLTWDLDWFIKFCFSVFCSYLANAMSEELLLQLLSAFLSSKHKDNIINIVCGVTGMQNIPKYTLQSSQILKNR